MSERRVLSAFFSYAHHDAETYPDLVKTYTETLERRINARLFGLDVRIWRDVDGVRLGAIWDERIQGAVKAAHVLIVLLSPRWIDSDYCQKEYALFRQVEPRSGDKGYVACILIRDFLSSKPNISTRTKQKSTPA
ncbi:toll/interleukin-1 receptor domain-containing protein [Methylocella sp.]|uniref:toll/interleukin-1 receptor domain-containing protein n=1 Tax=Methylocella sp. TaxID=1978226 RepID=UPI0037852D41